MTNYEYKYGGVLMTKPYGNKEGLFWFMQIPLTSYLKMKPESMDMIFADPPYFWSERWFFKFPGGNIVSVDKGDWD